MTLSVKIFKILFISKLKILNRKIYYTICSIGN